MVELSEVFQQPKFQSLCHDLLFHCRFLFVFRCDILKFSVFWQQAGHGGIYIVLIDITNQVRQLYIFQC